MMEGRKGKKGMTVEKEEGDDRRKKARSEEMEGEVKRKRERETEGKKRNDLLPLWSPCFFDIFSVCLSDPRKTGT